MKKVYTVTIRSDAYDEAATRSFSIVALDIKAAVLAAQSECDSSEEVVSIGCVADL